MQHPYLLMFNIFLDLEQQRNFWSTGVEGIVDGITSHF